MLSLSSCPNVRAEPGFYSGLLPLSLLLALPPIWASLGPDVYAD
jgi:hypothetical protein